MNKRSSICTSERLAQLEKAIQIIERGPQIPSPKIQKVENQLRENPDFSKYFMPRLLSIGPIHHGMENLKPGEQYKLIWTAMYLKENKQDPQYLCQKIEQHIEELKCLFTEDAIGNYNDNKTLVWMLFVDGCSLLQIMKKVDFFHPENLWIKPDQQEFVLKDLILLENQIPYKVLELLSNDEDTLVSSMINLAREGAAKKYMIHNAVTNTSLFKEDPERKPYHFLDFLRFIILGLDQDLTEIENRKQQTEIPVNGDDEHKKEVSWSKYKNIRELKTAGIQLESKKKIGLTYVSFVSNWFSGVLKLPWFYVDKSTPYTYLNMIAYEKCPDFHNNFEICSYLAFFDNLIDDANDVKELRLAGVIQNLLGSDEELAKLFNAIGTELASKGLNMYLSACKMGGTKKYIQVKNEIAEHCGNKWKTWMAEACNRYFSTPWSIAAFLAAVLALVLTMIQTWMAIHPNN